jgi:hypothetical protein
MDFNKATEILMAGMTRGEIAKALDRSEASVRQAKLDPSNNAHRSPPEGWEAVLGRLARQRATQLQKLADRLG